VITAANILACHNEYRIDFDTCPIFDKRKSKNMQMPEKQREGCLKGMAKGHSKNRVGI